VVILGARFEWDVLLVIAPNNPFDCKPER